MTKPPAVEVNEALADVFWDDDKDSINKELNQADTNNVLEENHSAGGPNDQVGVYSDSANNSALRFGIRFTTEQLELPFATYFIIQGTRNS
jgi:hypothetical protein